jgi:hypothetical protein
VGSAECAQQARGPWHGYLKIARAQSGITLRLIAGEPDADFTNLAKSSGIEG